MPEDDSVTAVGFALNDFRQEAGEGRADVLAEAVSSHIISLIIIFTILRYAKQRKGPVSYTHLKFAELNDDVLFGEVWSREDKLSLRDRSLVTVVALMAQGLTDESFRYHLTTAKKNGITREEIAEIVTHAAFYCGWPKAWAVFRMAKKIWNEEEAR